MKTKQVKKVSKKTKTQMSDAKKLEVCVRALLTIGGTHVGYDRTSYSDQEVCERCGLPLAAVGVTGYCPGPDECDGALAREALAEIQHIHTAWRPLHQKLVLCDMCGAPATYKHPRGGRRCNTCPKPE